jgi:hypothetical protein
MNSVGGTAWGTGEYTVRCYGPDGKEKWVENFHNLVVNEGLRGQNANYFAGGTQSATWYIGLVTGPGAGNTYAAGNTLASHVGWAENNTYIGGVRPTATLAAATTANPSVVTNAASPAVFTMNGNATIAGAFLCNVASGTSGTLFSVGNFAVGDRLCSNNDTLTVTYTYSLATP